MFHLKVGDTAPEFEGLVESGVSVKKSDYLGKKLILFFYPADNTPGCTAAACSLRDGYSELTSKGYQMLGVSPDNEKKHSGFIKKFNFPFSLLADTDHKVLEQFGIWGEKKFMGKTYDGVHRHTFILDEKGIISHIINKVDTKDHATQILELVG
jgi:thioredoxin-dependent peroxiredoxin